MATGQTINETASLKASRLEAARFYDEQDRQLDLLVEDCCKNALAGQTEGWFITLNTKAVFDGNTESDKAAAHFRRLERQVGILGSRLNGYCYRRRKDQRLRLLGGIEIGKENGRLHMHLVATHSGNVDRTLPEIRQFVVGEWQRLYQFDPNGFVHVRPIDDVYSAVRYIGKAMDGTRQFEEIR